MGSSSAALTTLLYTPSEVSMMKMAHWLMTRCRRRSSSNCWPSWPTSLPPALPRSYSHRMTSKLRLFSARMAVPALTACSTLVIFTWVSILWTLARIPWFGSTIRTDRLL